MFFNQNSLSGVIPTSLLLLSQLVALDLSNNRLSGTLFASQSDLSIHFPKLSILKVGDNQLSKAPLPSNLKNFVTLRTLDLSGNQFTGSIPYTFIENYQQLQILSLTDNVLTGPVPFSFCDFLGLPYQLQILDLQVNLNVMHRNNFTCIPSW